MDRIPSHYGIDTFYCQPGLQGAHEEGGVEGQIGWFRRNHLVPVPQVNSFDQLNAMVDEWDGADDARRIGTRPPTIGEHHVALGRHLHQYLRWRNANARHPDVLAAQRRERARVRVRSERQHRWGHPAAKAA